MRTESTCPSTDFFAFVSDECYDHLLSLGLFGQQVLQRFHAILFIVCWHWHLSTSAAYLTSMYLFEDLSFLINRPYERGLGYIAQGCLPCGAFVMATSKLNGPSRLSDVADECGDTRKVTVTCSWIESTYNRHYSAGRSEEMERSMAFDDLADLALIEILSYLSSTDALCAFTDLNHHWTCLLAERGFFRCVNLSATYSRQFHQLLQILPLNEIETLLIDRTASLCS